MLVSININNS